MFEDVYTLISDLYSNKYNQRYEINTTFGLDYRRYPNLKLILEPVLRSSNLPKIRLRFSDNLPNVDDIKYIINDLIQFATTSDLIKPSDEDQKFNNGYVRNIFDDNIVEWQRVDDEFYLVGYRKNLPHGLIECKIPAPLSNWNNTEPITHEYNYLKDYELEEGEELWSWYDMTGGLSGSSGFLIVKSKLVVKYAVEMFS